MLFLNAWFLGGLSLASVPVIIHLLNRRRFQRVDWAPMRVLKATIKTNRRRLRFEQLLLLALRTLAIIVLILAVARPLLAPGGAAWLPGRERTSRVIVFDTSLSMSYLDAGRPAIDSAKEAVTTLLATDNNSRDLVTILTTGDDNALVREAPLAEPKVAAAIKSVLPTDTRSDWPATFRKIDQALGVATFPSKEVVLLTDLRQSGWADVSGATNRWAKDGVKLRVIDVGTKQSTNVALVTLEQEQRIALANEPVRLKAQIRNDTPALISGATAVFTVGDEAAKRDRPVQLPDLPAGQTTDVPLTITPTAPGPLPVRLALTTDSLPRDDARELVIDVKPTVTVQLVDGRPSARPFDSATDFLSLSFALGATPWNTPKMTEPEFNAARTLDAVDAIVLADVASPSPARAKELEKLVRNGAALMIFAGDQLEIATYNDRLAPLLPGKFTGVVDAPATGLVIESHQASPLEALGRVAPAALARVQTKKYMGIDVRPNTEGVRVLARWNTSEAPPAVVEKHVGRGTVIVWLTTADKAWGDWPLDPTYVLAVRSAVTNIVRDDTARGNVVVGPAISLPIGEKAAAFSPTVKLPDGQSVSANVQENNVVLDRTNAAGLYRFGWKDAQSRPIVRLVSAAGDRAESDLVPVTDEALANFCGALPPTILHYRGAASLADRGREIWRTLATAALVMFVLEMGLATWVGRQK